MSEAVPQPKFDLLAAAKHLSGRDEKLKFLIAETQPFQMDPDHLQSPYEALLEAIAYQSISGKAAATIFARIKALSSTGRPPRPKKISLSRKQLSRQTASSSI